MKIIVTGAAGYIGQCLEKILKKKNVILLDKKSLNYKTDRQFYKMNLLYRRNLDYLFDKERISTIIHLAGESLVDEKKKYSQYYNNNIQVTKNILWAMKKYKCKNLIFSSTASVYKSINKPVTELSEVAPKSKYARSKLQCENLIKKTNNNFIILRFFNVASSLPSSLRGENHSPETHLIPLFIQNILLKKKLKIYGKNYPTKDGTCIRDFIHIKDICSAIIKCTNYLKKKNIREILNIGTNKGFSVLEILKNIKAISKMDIKYSFESKRKGDEPFLVSNFKKTSNLLNWIPKNSNIKKIISDEIKWKKINLN